jgi:hypothetical protein
VLLGFDLAERMSGSFYLHGDPFRERALRIALRRRVAGLRRFARERKMTADGTIVAEGIAIGDGREVSGTVSWKLLDQKRVPYDLAFEADDGRTYHLRGQRDFFVHDVRGSLTTMAASLFDPAGEEIGRAMLSFEPRLELPALVRSFRPRFRPRELPPRE